VDQQFVGARRAVVRARAETVRVVPPEDGVAVEHVPVVAGEHHDPVGLTGGVEEPPERADSVDGPREAKLAALGEVASTALMTTPTI
jgi:hypothetical protein